MEAGEMNRLRWRCRRGMRELDAILESFISESGDSLNASKTEAFSQLLDCEDDQLWDWLSGRITCADPQLIEIINDIRNTD